MLAVTTTLASGPAGGLALVGARDPGSTRVVYAIVIALALLGIGLAVFAWWLTRVTRPDPELLAPLEVMQSRRWQRLDPAGRRRLLDGVRPDGADPVDPAPAPPEPDEEFSDVPEPRDVRELADAEAGRPGAVVGEVGLARTVPAIRGDQWSEWDEALGLEQAGEGDGDAPGDGEDDAAGEEPVDEASAEVAPEARDEERSQ